MEQTLAGIVIPYLQQINQGPLITAHHPLNSLNTYVKPPRNMRPYERFY